MRRAETVEGDLDIRVPEIRCNSIGDFVDKVAVDGVAAPGLDEIPLAIRIGRCRGGVCAVGIVRDHGLVLPEDIVTGQEGIIPLLLPDLPDPLVGQGVEICGIISNFVRVKD